MIYLNNTREDHEVHIQDKHGRAILTVGVLRQLLEGLDNDTQVVMDDNEGWYNNIAVVGTTGDDDECYSALTFFNGSPCTTRQF